MFNPKQLLQKNRKSKQESKSAKNTDFENRINHYSESQSERGYRIERPQDVIRELQSAKKGIGTTTKKNKQKMQSLLPQQGNLYRTDQPSDANDHNLATRVSQLQQIVAKLTQQLSISNETVTQLKRQNSHLETMLLRSEYENAQLKNSHLVSEMKNSQLSNAYSVGKNHHIYGTKQDKMTQFSHVSHKAYLNSAKQQRQKSVQKYLQNQHSQQSVEKLNQKQTTNKKLPFASLSKNRVDARVIEEQIQEIFSQQVEQVLQQIKKEPLQTILKKKQYQFRALKATKRQILNGNKYLQKLANLQRQYPKTMKKPVLVIKFDQNEFEQ